MGFAVGVVAGVAVMKVDIPPARFSFYPPWLVTFFPVFVTFYSGAQPNPLFLLCNFLQRHENTL